MRSSFRSECGVAMVTVLLVGAVLTVVAATASFATIQELATSSDDSVSGQALAIAEAGVDRAIIGIRRGGTSSTGNIPWATMMKSGCNNNAEGTLSFAGNVGGGSFRATVLPAVPMTTCNLADVPMPNVPQRVYLTSTGTVGGAERTVQQEVRVGGTNLPIGLFATSDVDVNGAGNNSPARVRRISLVTGGNLSDRNFIAFDGYDPWYTQDDFYGNGVDNRCSDAQTAANTCNSVEHLPAAAHAVGLIECASNGPCGTTKNEHDPAADDHPVSCNANPNGSLANQSAWDGSFYGAVSTSGTVTSCANTAMGVPPTTKYPAPGVGAIPIPSLNPEEHANLKAAALSTGLYCTLTQCRIKGGTPFNNTGTFAGNDPGWATLPNNFTAYFDFPNAGYPQPPAHRVNWSANVSACSNNQATNKSAVIVVHNGDFTVAGGTLLSGAIIAQEGDVSFGGGASINGSVISRSLTVGGNGNFTLDDCALANLLFPFLDLTPVRWVELDRSN